MDNKLTDSKINDSNKTIYQSFDILPLLVDILKDVLYASSSSIDNKSNQVRVGDVTAPSQALKKKYEEALQLLDSLPGIDHNVEQQLELIKNAKKTNEKKRELIQVYKNTLFKGTIEECNEN